MIALLGAAGWGLLTIGAITHVWHHQRLRSLLGLHLDHERAPAVAITTAEIVLAVALPILVLAGSGAIDLVAFAGGAIGLGFVGWIARLLVTDSTLPCACSFSEAPPSVWSLIRALCVCLVVLFAFTEAHKSTATNVATLAVGLAVAAAIFVLPEALTWPPTSRALMTRVEAYEA